MPPGSPAAYYVSYSKQLEAGETVNGFVELTGEYHSADEISNWRIQIIGPINERVLDWEGNVANRQRYDFSFTAPRTGKYTIIVSHISRNSKNLVIEIQPEGWNPLGS